MRGEHGETLGCLPIIPSIGGHFPNAGHRPAQSECILSASGPGHAVPVRHQCLYGVLVSGGAGMPEFRGTHENPEKENEIRVENAVPSDPGYRLHRRQSGNVDSKMMNNIPETPLRTGHAESGCNYRLVTTPTGVVLCRNFDNTVGGACMLLLGFAIPLFAPRILVQWGIELPPVLVISLGAISAFGGLVLLLVDFFVRRYARSYEFDTKQRLLRVWRRGTIESEMNIARVAALQMAFAYYPSPETFWCYELNLVETQGDIPVRTNLISSDRRQGVEPLGRAMSGYLSVPLLDHTTKQHRLAEKIQQKSNKHSQGTLRAPAS